MGRNSSFDEGASGDSTPNYTSGTAGARQRMEQGQGLDQGPTFAQGSEAMTQGGGNACVDSDNGGFSGGFLSDVRNVITNPTQTPLIGEEVRFAAGLGRAASSIGSGGATELPAFVNDLRQGDPVAGGQDRQDEIRKIGDVECSAFPRRSAPGSRLDTHLEHGFRHLSPEGYHQ